MKYPLLHLLFIACVAFPLFSSAAGGAAAVEDKPANSVAIAAEQTIDLNSADATTLQRMLNGVGAVKAQAIVDYRQEHGPFASVDELLEVKGIGAALLEKNRSKLRVD